MSCLNGYRKSTNRKTLNDADHALIAVAAMDLIHLETSRNPDNGRDVTLRHQWLENSGYIDRKGNINEKA